MEHKIEGTNVTLKVEQPAAMKPTKIKMIADGLGKNNALLKAGETYEVPQENADWNVKLGRAEFVDSQGDAAAKPGDAVKGTGHGQAVQTSGPATELLDEIDPETLTVADLKEHLTRVGAPFDVGAHKAELTKAYAKALKAQSK